MRIELDNSIIETDYVTFHKDTCYMRIFLLNGKKLFVECKSKLDLLEIKSRLMCEGTINLVGYKYFSEGIEYSKQLDNIDRILSTI